MQSFGHTYPVEKVDFILCWVMPPLQKWNTMFVVHTVKPLSMETALTEQLLMIWLALCVGAALLYSPLFIFLNERNFFLMKHMSPAPSTLV